MGGVGVGRIKEQKYIDEENPLELDETPRHFKIVEEDAENNDSGDSDKLDQRYSINKWAVNS